MTDARVVRTDSGGRRDVTDGPFTESKEFVGGYYLVDVASIDRAVELAARFVEARFAPVEVRRLGPDTLTREGERTMLDVRTEDR